jgi:hypothetical protein
MKIDENRMDPSTNSFACSVEVAVEAAVEDVNVRAIAIASVVVVDAVEMIAFDHTLKGPLFFQTRQAPNAFHLYLHFDPHSQPNRVRT